MENKTSVIRKMHDMLVKKEMSCKEITAKYLDEIKKSELNAYVKVCEDTAFSTANAVDKKISQGEEISMLEGIPMTLKDNMSTKGIETTCCSKILKGYEPIYDATVWSTLKSQNAVLLGKANMDEFAMGSSCENSCFGGAANPHNLKHVAGGSSGGVAAAVGGNIAAYGLGSDTGGSIRQPASFCGIVGLKPTYGSVSRYGLVAYASSLDQIGPIASTVEDVSLVYDAIAGYDSKDSTSSKLAPKNTFDFLNKDIKGMKIGIAKEYFEGIGGEIKEAIDKAISTFEEMGAEVESFSLSELKYALPVYYIIACAEASSNLGRYDGIRYGHKTDSYKDINEMICKTRSEGFGEEVKRRILLGNYVLSSGYYDAYYKKAQKVRTIIKQEFAKLFEKYDLLLTPTSPTVAYEIGTKSNNPLEMYLADLCTVSVNIAGLPGISIPCGVDKAGLPIGLQLIGKPFGEETIIQAAYTYEQEVKFRENHKPTFKN